MNHILCTLGLVLGLSSFAYSATTTVTQTFSNNAVGTLYDGESTTLILSPSFTASQIQNATQLDLVFTVRGAAHKYVQSLDAIGSSHALQILTSVSYAPVDSTLFTSLDSDSIQSLWQDVFVGGNSGGDSSEVIPDTFYDYTVTWSTTDQSVISSFNNSTLQIGATVDQELGSDASLSVLFGKSEYSNIRLDGVTSLGSALLTISVPEPSSLALLGVSSFVLCFKRRR